MDKVAELTFDGSSLTLTENGVVVGSWPAVSGRLGFQNPEQQNAVGKGPVPEGTWTFDLDDVQMRDNRDGLLGLFGRGRWPGAGMSWGPMRAFLKPTNDVNTFGRSGFSIHGGSTYGSAGCIDLAGNVVDFFMTLARQGYTDARVRVQYGDSVPAPLGEDQPLETSPWLSPISYNSQPPSSRRTPDRFSSRFGSEGGRGESTYSDGRSTSAPSPGSGNSSNPSNSQSGPGEHQSEGGRDNGYGGGNGGGRERSMQGGEGGGIFGGGNGGGRERAMQGDTVGGSGWNDSLQSGTGGDTLGGGPTSGAVGGANGGGRERAMQGGVLGGATGTNTLGNGVGDDRLGGDIFDPTTPSGSALRDNQSPNTYGPSWGQSSPGWGGKNPPNVEGVPVGSNSQTSPSGAAPGGTGKAPILLDLDGNGLTVDTLDTSSMFLDLDGDGYKQRMAWAGKGDGVLVFDADGDGEISRSKEIVFTEWAEGTDSDLEALKQVFDSDGDGQLDSGDAKWGDFRVMVDGQMKTLDALKITSIDLTPFGSGQNFQDGSSIAGRSTFTIDGNTRTVGDAVLAVDGNEYLIDDKSNPNTLKGFAKDGWLDFSETRSVSSSGGIVTETTTFDDNGDGVTDRTQTDATKTLSGGEIERTVSNFNADGSLADKTITKTSAGRNAVVTELDQNGDGIIDQKQTFKTNSDYTTETTVTEYSIAGDKLMEVETTTSADKLTKLTYTRATGTTINFKTTDVTTVNGSNGVRTRTVSDMSADGDTLFSREETVTSKTGRTRTVRTDADGDGVYEERVLTTMTVESDGRLVTTVSTFAGNSTSNDEPISQTISSTSADGLVKMTAINLDGDKNNLAEFVTTDTTLIGSNGTTTITSERRSRDGHGMGSTTTTTSADHKIVVITTDADGDGATDSVERTSVDSNGDTTTTFTLMNPDGSLKTKSITTTLKDGNSKTSQVDVDGDGVYDLKTTEVLAPNSSGNPVRSVTTYSENGTVIGKSYTSAATNGISRSAGEDLDGDGTTDRKVLSNVDYTGGVRTVTTTAETSTGVDLSVVTEVTKADRRTVTTTVDANGDTKIDQKTVSVLNANGSRVVTVTDFDARGDLGIDTKSVIGVTKTEITADKLTVTTTYDVDGNGSTDSKIEDVTVIETDGDSRRTVTELPRDANEDMISRVVTTTSANGLSIVSEIDADGQNGVERKVSDVTTLLTSGSTRRTITNLDGNDAVINKVVTTVVASGLTTTEQVNIDGAGGFDRTTVTTTGYGANGTKTDTATVTNYDGKDISETKTVTTADKRSITTTTDLDGDTDIDQRHTTKLEDDGDTVDTFYTYDAADPTEIDSKLTLTVSANRLNSTAVWDIDGNGTDGTTISEKTLDANGIWTQTVKNLDAAGSQKDKTVIKTESGGLKTTTQWYAAGATTTRSAVDETVLDDTGETTRTITYYKAGGTSVESKSVTTTTADKKSSTTTYDFNGNSTVDRTITSTINSDGSITEIHSGRIPDDDFESESGEIWINTSGNGTSKTVEYRDHSGSGHVLIGKEVTTLSILNDGAVTTTTDFFTGATSTRVGREIVSTAANGLSSEAKWDVNGDLTIDLSRTSATVLAKDGLETTTVDIEENGSLARRFVTAESANGLSVETKWRIYGADSLYDDNLLQDSTDLTVLNSSGTRTRTITNVITGGVDISKFVTTTSANGLSTTTTEDLDGNGVIDRTRTWTAKTLAGGSTIETRKAFEGSTTSTTKLLESETVTVNTADRSTTINRDADGDGKVDQREVTTKAVDGSVNTTITNFTVTGSDTITTISTSANGLETKWAWDFDGDGDFDQRRSSVGTDLLAGGEYLTKTIDTTVSPGDDPVTRIIWTTKSLDGRVFKTNTRYATDNSSDRRETFTTNVDGSVAAYTENDGQVGVSWLIQRGHVYWDQKNIAQQVAAKTSADGLTTVTFANFDATQATSVFADDLQSKGYEFKEVAQTQIDGSVIKTITETKSGGMDKGVIAVSADGRTTTLKKDTDGDGDYQHIETSTVRIDGSIRHVAQEFDPTGKDVTQTVITEVSADGRKTVVLTSTNGTSGTGTSTGAYVDFTSGATTSDTITGTIGSDDLDGGAGADTLNGGDGNDWLDGGTGLDKLNGGDGNDTYVVDNAGDIVYETTDEGLDTVRSSIDYTLVDKDLERLTLTSVAAKYAGGNVRDNTITASSSDNEIEGFEGDDILYGRDGNDTILGGTGNDEMFGEAGDDTMTGALGKDQYVFGRGGGYDKVRDMQAVDAPNERAAANAAGAGGPTGTAREWVGGYFWDDRDDSISKLVDGGTEDTLVLQDGINAEDLSLSWSGSKNENLYIDISGGPAGDKVYLQQQAVAVARVEYLEMVGLGETASEVVRMLFDVARTNGGTLSGTSSNEVLFGLDGAETLNGNDGNDILYGGAGNDKLNGGNGNDRMFGRAGNDTMSGALGEDQYVFGRGDGSDTVSDSGDDDTLVLEDGIKAENLSFAWGGSTGQDLTITVAGGPAGDSLVIKQQDTTAGRIEYLKLDSLSAAMLFDVARTGGATLNGTSGADLLFGLAGVDKLNGGDGDDVIYGLAGNDTLTGALGKDRYVFGRGDGSDTVSDSGDDDTLILVDGIKAEDLSFSWNSTKDNLTIDISGGPAGDSLLMQQQGVAAARVEYLELDGVGKMMFDVALTSGGTLDGTSSNELLFGLNGAETLNGDEGNDRLYGGAGNDFLNGGKGHDTYVFEAGGGADTIFESGIYGDNDDLVFGSGIDWNELWFQQQGNSLVVSVLGTTDKVTVQDWFINPGRVVETMHSGDGKTLHSSEITTLVAAMAAFQPGTSSGAGSAFIIDPEDTRLGIATQIGTVAYARKSAWAAY
ncbi:hypothetical protein [Mesorhizobium sp. IMUNJ 23232]|uniref:hypothetical protein n=1 Tax=Mesorhizobium sp. IMUNJ 23232 TaxID=3376064 RepID=UPI003797D654